MEINAVSRKSFGADSFVVDVAASRYSFFSVVFPGFQLSRRDSQVRIVRDLLPGNPGGVRTFLLDADPEIPQVMQGSDKSVGFSKSHHNFVLVLPGLRLRQITAQVLTSYSRFLDGDGAE